MHRLFLCLFQLISLIYSFPIVRGIHISIVNAFEVVTCTHITILVRVKFIGKFSEGCFHLTYLCICRYTQCLVISVNLFIHFWQVQVHIDGSVDNKLVFTVTVWEVGWAAARFVEPISLITALQIFSIRSSVELSRPVVVHCHGHLPFFAIWACP